VQPKPPGLFAKRVVDPMGQFLATQHLSHDEKGLFILRPGSVSSVLLDCVLLTRDATRRPGGEGIILWARDLTTFCMWLAGILAVLVLYDLFSIVI
jgi:hypothetical protein